MHILDSSDLLWSSPWVECVCVFEGDTRTEWLENGVLICLDEALSMSY